MKRPTGMVLGLFGLLLWASTEAGVGEPTDQLRAAVDQIIKVLDDPALKFESKAAERHAAVGKESVVVFDFTETAKRALGRPWDGPYAELVRKLKAADVPTPASPRS